MATRFDPTPATDDDSPRDRFAAAALTGLLANPTRDQHPPARQAADAWALADAMLVERKP